jgi:adenylate kinase family enzyme
MAGMRADDAPMRRILLIGCGGAGKSRLAQLLGERLDLPVVHLDVHFWRPGWQEPDRETWRAQLGTLAAKPDWVMEGNYINTFDIRMPRADSLVWLDYPRTTCMRRVLMRTLKWYGRTRPDLAPGCPEGFDREFLSYVWNFQRAQNPRIVASIDQFGSHLHVTRLGTDHEVEEFLARLEAA